MLAVIDWACTDLGEIPYDVTRPLDMSVKKLFKDHVKMEYIVGFPTNGQSKNLTLSLSNNAPEFNDQILATKQKCGRQ